MALCSVRYPASLHPVDLNDAPEAGRLRSLWAAHVAERFPSAVDTGEDAGADLVMLDADIAGVLDSVLASRRPPNVEQQRMLRACIAQSDCAAVVKPAQQYFSRLREMADLALSTAGHREQVG